MEQGTSLPMDVSVEMAEQSQVNPMETGPEESMEISQPAASPSPSLPEKWLYKSRSVLWPQGQKGLGPLHLISPLQHGLGCSCAEDKPGRNPRCASKAIFERRRCEGRAGRGCAVGAVFVCPADLFPRYCRMLLLLSCSSFSTTAAAQVLHLVTHLVVKRPPGQECAE